MEGWEAKWTPLKHTRATFPGWPGWLQAEVSAFSFRCFQHSPAPEGVMAWRRPRMPCCTFWYEGVWKHALMLVEKEKTQKRKKRNYVGFANIEQKGCVFNLRPVTLIHLCGWTLREAALNSGKRFQKFFPHCYPHADQVTSQPRTTVWSSFPVLVIVISWS